MLCRVDQRGGGGTEIVYPDRWDKQGILNSIIIIDKKKCFRVFPIVLGGWGVEWTMGGMRYYVDGCTYATFVSSYSDLMTQAMQDFGGEENTEATVSAFGDAEPYRDASLYTAKVASSVVFPDGVTHGYLPAFGERGILFNYTTMIPQLLQGYSYNFSNYPLVYPSWRYGFYKGYDDWNAVSTRLIYDSSNYTTMECMDRCISDTEYYYPLDTESRKYRHFEIQTNRGSYEYGYPFNVFGRFDNS